MPQPVAQIPWGYNRLIISQIKDPYDFDFLGLEDDALEKEIETELTKAITDEIKTKITNSNSSLDFYVTF